MRWGVALHAGVLAILGLGTALAHHSVAGQFDMTKPFTLTGVISRVDWINPHIYIHLDTKDGEGRTVTWRLETVPTAMARKAGLTKKMLLGNGETVSIDVFPARDGTSHLGYINKITYPDGRFYQFGPEVQREGTP